MPKIKKHIPNYLTIFNVGIGLGALIFAYTGQIDRSAGLILVSAVVDSVDGYIARKLKSTTILGSYLDTVSDFIAFGAAAGALIGVVYGVHPAIIVVFAAASAARLAMFMRSDVKTCFFGVPTTACGTLLSSMVMADLSMARTALFGIKVMDIMMLALSALMVCKVRYQKINLRSRKTLTVFMALLSSIFIFNHIFFAAALSYMTMGYVLFGWVPARKC